MDSSSNISHNIIDRAEVITRHKDGNEKQLKREGERECKEKCVRIWKQHWFSCSRAPKADSSPESEISIPATTTQTGRRL